VYEVFDPRGREHAVKVLHDVPGGTLRWSGSRAGLARRRSSSTRTSSASKNFEPVEPMSWRRISSSE